MSNELARRRAVDISADNITWVRLIGTTDINDQDTPTYVDTTDYDTNGFASTEITLHTWAMTVKFNRKSAAGVFDPVQELIRAARFQFGTAARLYVRWYDRNGKPDARTGLAIVEWNQSKSGVGDVEEITVNFKGDGAITSIANPGNSTLPVVLSATPSGLGVGALLTIGGQFLTGPVVTTGVKVGGVNATSWTVVSDTTIVAVMPAGSAGSAPVLVTTAAGASNSFPYTRT
jgi:hypothetical protein